MWLSDDLSDIFNHPSLIANREDHYIEKQILRIGVIQDAPLQYDPSAFLSICADVEWKQHQSRPR